MADLTQHTTDAGIVGVISKIDLTSVGGAGIYEIHDAKAIHDVSDLGLGNAVIFKGLVPEDGLPTASASTVGHVYLDAASNKEYIGVKTGATTYAWEPLGNIHSAASATHTHNVPVTGTNADSAASVSGTVSEFLGEVTTGKPTINVTVGTHPGITVNAPTSKVLGDGTTVTATASSAMDSNVVTGVTTKYLSVGSVALNTDTVTEVTGNTDVVATKTVFGTSTTASKVGISEVSVSGEATDGTAISVPQHSHGNNVTAAGSKTDGTAISVPQHTHAANVTASKLSSAGSVTKNTSFVKGITAGSGSFTATVTNEVLSFSHTHVSAKASGSAQAVTAVTLPTFTDVTAAGSKTDGSAISVPQHTHAANVTAAGSKSNGTAISVPQHTHAANTKASVVTATDVTVPVVSSNAEVTASKVTTGNVTVATSVKTQPALAANTSSATGRIAYVASASTGKVGITTTVTPTITPEEISAVTSVSASTSSPTVTAALASDVVTGVAAKSKTVSLSGTAKAQTWTQKSGTTGQPIN